MASLNVKDAGIRAVRTFFQTFAAGLIGLPIASAISEIKVVGGAFLLVLYSSILAAGISFAQNVAEDNTALDVPKG